MSKLILILVSVLLCGFVFVPKPQAIVVDGFPDKDVRNTVEYVKASHTALEELDVVPVTPQDWARIEWRKHGWSESDWQALVKLWGNESGWNTNAVNPTSGACGIPQAWPCSKIGANWRDPETQLKWGAQYIKDRYGTPSSALAYWYSQCGSSLGCWY